MTTLWRQVGNAYSVLHIHVTHLFLHFKCQRQRLAERIINICPEFHVWLMRIWGMLSPNNDSQWFRVISLDAVVQRAVQWTNSNWKEKGSYLDKWEKELICQISPSRQFLFSTDRAHFHYRSVRAILFRFKHSYHELLSHKIHSVHDRNCDCSHDFHPPVCRRSHSLVSPFCLMNSRIFADSLVKKVVRFGRRSVSLKSRWSCRYWQWLFHEDLRFSRR